MNIVNVSGDKVKACATFHFQGFLVSMSTIFNGVPVIAFGNDGTELEGDTVEDVLKQIIGHNILTEEIL